MTWLKNIGAVGVGAAALMTGGAARMAISQASGGDPVTAQEIVGTSRTAYAALSSYSDSGTAVSEFAGQKNTLTFNIRLQRPNHYRIDWTQGTESKGVIWCDGSGDYFLATTAGQQENAKPQRMQNMKHAFAQAAGLSFSCASTISRLFFDQGLGDLFTAPVASGLCPLQKEKDGNVGDVSCYVVSGVMDSSKQPEKGKPGTAFTMLWIGKKDFLIHQSRMKYVEKLDSSAATSEEAIDEAIKKALETQNKPATPQAIAAMRPQMEAIMKRVQTTLKSGFESGVVITQTHENIVVN
jgi:hypothetical protein